MALPDFSKFKAPYRFVPEGRAFRLYEKGVKTNTTFKTMDEAKKKVLGLNDAWRASPAGRKATPKKKYDAGGHVVRKPAPRARANPDKFGFDSDPHEGFDRTQSRLEQREAQATLRNLLKSRVSWKRELGEQVRDGVLPLDALARILATREGIGPHARQLLNRVRPGYYVTVVSPRGEEVTGRAMTLDARGWVLDVRGSSVIANEDNVVAVSREAPLVGNPRRVGMFSTIQPGDRVTIVTPRGQEMTGRAMMKGPAGWVLNVGGRYGTPALADEDNIVKVSKTRRNPRSLVPSGAPEEVVEVAETLLANAKEAGFSETFQPVYVSQHGPKEWHVGSNFEDSALWLHYIDGTWYYWNPYEEEPLKPMRGGFKEALANARIWWTG